MALLEVLVLSCKYVSVSQLVYKFEGKKIWVMDIYNIQICLKVELAKISDKSE